MKTYPRNPNVTEFSDVFLELDRATGHVVEFMGIPPAQMTQEDAAALKKAFADLDHAKLRVAACLWPSSLVAEDWEALGVP